MKTSLIETLMNKFPSIDSDVVQFIWTDCQCDFEKACKQLTLLLDTNNNVEKTNNDDNNNKIDEKDDKNINNEYFENETK